MFANSLIVALMRCLESTFVNAQNNLTEPLGVLNLHPAAATRLRRAILQNAAVEHLPLEADEALQDRQGEPKYSCLHSIAARKRHGRFSDLRCWPTPGEAATQYLCPDKRCRRNYIT